MRPPEAQRRARLLVALGVALLLLAAGAVVLRVGGSTPGPTGDDRRPGAGTERHGSAGLDSRPGDEPGRSQHDETGAATAAVTYASMPQRWLYLADHEVLADVAEMATPAAAERIGQEVLGEVRAARDRLVESAGAVWWIVHPLAWSVESYGGDHATVAVWTVSVLSAPGVAAPQSEWATVTIDLAWHGGAWRAAAVRDRPGPTPATGPGDEPWDARAFDGSLAGYTRLVTGQELAG